MKSYCRRCKAIVPVYLLQFMGESKRSVRALRLKDVLLFPGLMKEAGYLRSAGALFSILYHDIPDALGWLLGLLMLGIGLLVGVAGFANPILVIPSSLPVLVEVSLTVAYVSR